MGKWDKYAVEETTVKEGGNKWEKYAVEETVAETPVKETPAETAIPTVTMDANDGLVPASAGEFDIKNPTRANGVINIPKGGVTSVALQVEEDKIKQNQSEYVKNAKNEIRKLAINTDFSAPPVDPMAGQQQQSIDGNLPGNAVDAKVTDFERNLNYIINPENLPENQIQLSKEDKDDLAIFAQKAAQVAPAIQKYSKELEQKPDDVETLNKLAENLAFAGDTSGALSHFTKANSIQENGASLMGLGNVYLEAGDNENARNAFEDAYYKDKNPDALIKAAYAESALGNTASSLEMIDNIKEEFPNYSYGYALSAYNNEKLGDKSAAAVDNATYEILRQQELLPEALNATDPNSNYAKERASQYARLGAIHDAIAAPINFFGEMQMGTIKGGIEGLERIGKGMEAMLMQNNKVGAFLDILLGSAETFFSGAMLGVIPGPTGGVKAIGTNVAFHSLPEPVNKVLMQPLDIVMNLSDEEAKELTGNRAALQALGNTLGSILFLGAVHGKNGALSKKEQEAIIHIIKGESIEGQSSSLKDIVKKAKDYLENSKLSSYQEAATVFRSMPADLPLQDKISVAPDLVARQKLQDEMAKASPAFKGYYAEKIRAIDENIQSKLTSLEGLRDQAAEKTKTAELPPKTITNETVKTSKVEEGSGSSKTEVIGKNEVGQEVLIPDYAEKLKEISPETAVAELPEGISVTFDGEQGMISKSETGETLFTSADGKETILGGGGDITTLAEKGITRNEGFYSDKRGDYYVKDGRVFEIKDGKLKPVYEGEKANIERKEAIIRKALNPEKPKGKKVEPVVEEVPAEDVKTQIENFGVPKEDVEATHSLLGQVFDGLKKAGLTVAKTVGDWVGIGKGSEKPYSLKINGKDVKVDENYKVSVDGKVVYVADSPRDAQRFIDKNYPESNQDQNGGFKTRDGKPIGFTYDTDKVARERFDFSKLEKIGSGSDRDVYDLGNGRVLKVAKTARGLTQNIYEGDHYLTSVVPEVFERGQNYVVAEKTPRIKTTDVVETFDWDGNVIGKSTAGEMIKELKELYQGEMLKNLEQFSKNELDKHNSKMQEVLVKYGLQDIMNYNVLWADFVAQRNWGYKEGKAYHSDGGTFGGIEMISSHKNKTNLSDPEFKKIYEESKKLKKEFGDTDKATMYKKEDGEIQAQYRIQSGKNIIEAIKNFAKSKNKAEATVAVTHEIMHPTVVSIIDGAKEGNEIGKKHTATIIEEYNKANPNDKITESELIQGNEDFKGGNTGDKYRAVQEFIAKAWEKYHTEGGKGFSAEFQKVLDQITKAFQAVYKSLKPDQVTPELRKMFDEILGKEESVSSGKAKEKAGSVGVGGDVASTAKALEGKSPEKLIPLFDVLGEVQNSEFNKQQAIDVINTEIEMLPDDIKFAKDKERQLQLKARLDYLSDPKNKQKEVDNLFKELEKDSSEKLANSNKKVAEAYHKAKADGSNPELVKAVEQSIKEAPEAEIPVDELQFPAKEQWEIDRDAAKEHDKLFDEDEIRAAYEQRDQGLSQIKRGKDFKTQVIHENFGGLSLADWTRYGDANWLKGKEGKAFKKKYIKENDRTNLEEVADEMSANSGVEITPQDIVDYIIDREANPKKYDGRLKQWNDAASIPKKDVSSILTGDDAMVAAIVESNRGFGMTDLEADTIKRYVESKAKNEARAKNTKSGSAEGAPKSARPIAKSERVGRKPSEKAQKKKDEAKSVKAEESKYVEAEKKITKIFDALREKMKSNLPEGTQKMGLDAKDVLDAAEKIVKAALKAGEAIEAAIQKGKDYISENWKKEYGEIDENNVFVEPKPTKVYHGGSKIDISKASADNPIFISESKEQAGEYAKGNKGGVQEFEIDKNSIANEDVAREVISEMNLKSKNPEWNVEELNLFELIDPRFDTSLSNKDIKKVYSKLKEKGYTGIEFYDTNLISLKQDIKNIVLFDSKRKNIEASKYDAAEKSVASAFEKLREKLIPELPEGTKKMGLGMEDLLNAAEKVIITAIRAGEKIDVAIGKGIEHLKEKWDESFGEFPEKELRDILKEGGEKEIQLAHEKTDILREELGMEPRAERDTVPIEQTVAEARRRIKKGVNVEKIADEIIRSKDPATPVEHVILSERVAQLNKELLEMDPSDPLFDKKYAEAEKLIKASELSGSQAGEALGIRAHIKTVADDSLISYFQEQKRVNKDAPLTENQKAANKKEFEAITKAKEAYEKKIAKLQEENNRLKAEKQVEKIAKKASKRTAKEKLDEDFDALAKEFSSIAKNTLNAGINPELIPVVLKMVKNRVEKGVITLSEVVDAVHEKVGEFGISKEDIIAAIAGKHGPERTRSEAAKNGYELKQEAKLVQKLMDLQNGKEPSSERGKIQKNIRLEELRKQIKEHDLTKTAEYKKRLDAQIAEVERELATGDFAKEEKAEPLKLDKETLELQDKYMQLSMEREARLLKEEYAQRSMGEKAGDIGMSLLNAPMTLMSSGDLSAVLRQGLVASTSHPILAARASKQMLKFFKSQKDFDRWHFETKNDPRYLAAKEAGLAIVDPQNPKLAAREEAFMGNIVEKIPLYGKGIKLAKIKDGKLVRTEGEYGGLVKASERAYVGFLNKMRWDVYNLLSERLKDQGITFENNPTLYKELASHVNNITGRGNIPKNMERLSPALNAAFFSPRLWASRLKLLSNFMNPLWYKKVPKEVRRFYWEDMGKFAATATIAYLMAGAGGSDVETDIRSSDFLKIRNGKKRYDILGGFQQPIRTLGQYFSGESKNIETGEIKELSDPDLPIYDRLLQKSRLKPVVQHIRGKLSPVPAAVYDMAIEGKMMDQQTPTLWKEAKRMMGPLAWQDIVSAYGEEGAKSFVTTAPPTLLGVSNSIYKDPEPEPKEKPKPVKKKKKRGVFE